jgi:ribose 1,5-bisphosphokinase PhnN
MSVVWLHGPTGAGKSTLANALRALVNPVSTVALLDEDEVKEAIADAALWAAADASASALAERVAAFSIGRLAAVARVLSQQGLVVIVAASDCPPPALAWNRANLPGYREIYLHASAETIKHRARRRRRQSPYDATPPISLSIRPPAIAVAAVAAAAADLTIDMDNPEPPELIAFRVAVLIPEFVVAAAGAANPANPALSRFRRGA